MKKNFLRLSLLVLWIMAGSVFAQNSGETLQVWNLSSWSENTMSNLAADTEMWEPSYKSNKLIRYANKTATDGNLLTAMGEIIEETDGLYIGEGIEAGSLLLRHNMGSDQNGVQMQRNRPVTIKDLKQGQELHVTLRSSSSTPQGIASVVNLEGEYGEGTYTASSLKTYTLRVVEHGDVSFTNSGGIVINKIELIHGVDDSTPQVEAPVVDWQNGEVTLSTATQGAEIYYSLVDHSTAQNYAIPYAEPFKLYRSVRLRAYAIKDGMRDSEVTEQYIDVPLVMPFEGRTFVLDPEELGRGAIACGSGSIWVINWRWLVTDPADASFNIYRDGTLINSTPISKFTYYTDIRSSSTAQYTIEMLSGGQVVETSKVLKLPNYKLDIPVNRPAGGTNKSGSYEYTPGDCMVADVDADKEYEIVMMWEPTNRQDNSISGYTGNVLIDCYEMDGTQLWRIDLGQNIRAGAHYTQLMVYDLDQDGKAEVACKTAPGTIDGKGKYVVLNNDDPSVAYANSSGYILSGPEYLTVFSGLTGEELQTIPYRPARDYISNWGDSYGNRMDRYLAAVAYLDGKRPSLVMCRGYYTAAFLWAVDWDGTSLTTKWLHESKTNGLGAYGEGAHSMSVADVDGDLCDEIIYGACAIDNDGTLIYRTGLGHGDALHVGDFMPDRPGLEVMMVHEETSAKYGVEMHDALTGEILSGYYTGTDVGRGLCADVDGTSRGAEYWSTADNNVYDITGTSISTRRPSVNFRTYWDGDLQSETFEKGVITKFAGRTTKASTLVDFTTKYGAGTNPCKSTPCLQADIFGDWREEVILYDNSTCSTLYICAANTTTSYKVPTLMHDHHYRMATITQNAAYNQPPHLSYYLPDYVNYLKDNPIDIDQIETPSRVRTRTYYNMCGEKVNTPMHGIYVMETEYEDGRTVRTKIAR